MTDQCIESPTAGIEEVLTLMILAQRSLPGGERADHATTATATLMIRSIESALNLWWEKCGPPVDRASTRSRLVCLPLYMDDRHLAREISLVWSQLHQGGSREQLGRWLDTTARFVEAVSQELDPGDRPELACSHPRPTRTGASLRPPTTEPVNPGRQPWLGV